MPSGDVDGVEVRALAFGELDRDAAYDLWRLRQQVFVVEQGSPYPDLDGRDREATTRHLLAYDARGGWGGCGGVLVGTARILDDGDALRIGRLAVAADHRGRGIAGRLMDAAMALVLDAGRPARLDAQTGLVGWYGSYGFSVSGPEFVEEGVVHIPMARPAQRT